MQGGRNADMQYIDPVQQGIQLREGLDGMLSGKAFCAFAGSCLDANHLHIGAMHAPGRLDMETGGEASADNTRAYLGLAHDLDPPTKTT
jgi:hypothetical protein